MSPSIIGEDLTIVGNTSSTGEIHVQGKIQGDIHCATLIVGPSAEISGGVVAEDVTVQGRVMGSIRGERVSLQSSSHVEGDVFHKSLAIEQGAYFEGKSRRSENPVAEAPRPEARPAVSLSGHGNGSGGSHAPNLPLTASLAARAAEGDRG